MNIDYTNCQMCLGYSRRTNMGLGPCNADINPHAQPLSCWMHMMSHGLRCLCQGPGPFKQQFSHLHQVISSVSVQKSVHSPVQSPGFTPTRYSQLTWLHAHDADEITPTSGHLIPAAVLSCRQIETIFIANRGSTSAAEEF